MQDRSQIAIFLCRKIRSGRARFEKNKIKVIENLGHLKYLKKLDLGQNLITKIQGISDLESLTQLSLEDNEISKLNGFDDI